VVILNEVKDPCISSFFFLSAARYAYFDSLASAYFRKIRVKLLRANAAGVQSSQPNNDQLFAGTGADATVSLSGAAGTFVGIGVGAAFTTATPR
jgi:hypothetical protein